MGCFHSKQDDNLNLENDCIHSQQNYKQQQERQLGKIQQSLVVEGECVGVKKEGGHLPLSLPPQKCEIEDVEIVPKLTACGMKHIGFGPLKRENQDMFVVKMEEIGMRKGSLFAVFDGHGMMGRYAAEFAQQIMPLVLNQAFSMTQQKQCSGQVASYVEAIKEDIQIAFLETERRMIESGVNMSNSGTTASIVYLEGYNMWVGSVGDSRVVLGSCNEQSMMQSIQLTEDHRPSNPNEKQRIEAAGGRVEPKTNVAGEQVGEPRVWLKDAQTPGLMVTRSLGDCVASKVGCTSKPQVEWIPLRPSQDDFIVLATDGVWDVLPTEQVVDMVYSAQDAPSACKSVMSSTLIEWERRWAADNITIIVVTFHWDYAKLDEEEEEEDEDDDECVSPVTTLRGPSGGLNSIAEQDGF
eukprot:TRINITY_DN14041_c1_g2_i2.p1 TRINITY_DN14041_c1_g2~~TRINITY_DN14041_c1_g2_i2.p1  ORF type:complete len:410 (-),score=67.80 TRINITY_DN14041_c1_g2_i2:376-1605(-)